MPAAWAAVTSAERNRLARQVLSGAVVENKTVVAVAPWPEVAAFFALVAVGEKSGDAAPGDPGDGVQSGVSAEVTGVGSIGSVWDLVLPPNALLIGNLNWTDRRYAAPRARKLSPQHEALIRTAASRGATLRQLAAEHGVSHVTVARIVRDAPSGTQTDSQMPRAS